MRFHKLEEYLRTPFGAAMMGAGKGSADFVQLVRDAQKFYAGDVCVLPDPVDKIREDWHRLPYPICLFEFQDVDPKEVKRPFFILAEELCYSDERVDCMRVHSFTVYAIPAYMGEDLYLHSGYVEINRVSGTYNAIANVVTLKFLSGGDGFKKLAGPEQLHDSMVACADWLNSFLSVLNCSNVEIAEVSEPKFLNKKRLKKGKVPIYSYKTLVLKTRQQRLENGIGTHDSPRIHLRRGHIKRRKTGNFWWEPCVVGDRKRGIVVKDYRADELVH